MTTKEMRKAFELQFCDLDCKEFYSNDAQCKTCKAWEFFKAGYLAAQKARKAG